MTATDAKDWLAEELSDVLDEEMELVMEDTIISKEIARIYKEKHPDALDNKVYLTSLMQMQAELIRLQDWVKHTGQKVVVLFEGRDSAGKGGVIKRITQRLNPRICLLYTSPSPRD